MGDSGEISPPWLLSLLLWQDYLTANFPNVLLAQRSHSHRRIEEIARGECPQIRALCEQARPTWWSLPGPVRTHFMTQR